MRRPVAAAALVIALAGCSSGGGSTSPSTTSAPTTATPTTTRPTASTVATTTIPLGPTTTGAVTTTTAAAAASTTTASTAPTSTLATVATTTIPLATTTTQAPATTTTSGGSTLPCDAALLLKAANDKFDLPAGATATDPRCAQNWASALVTAPGQDKAFAVFEVIQGEWDGQNLGTFGVCSGAGVPGELYGPLNCDPWES